MRPHGYPGPQVLAGSWARIQVELDVKRGKKALLGTKVTPGDVEEGVGLSLRRLRQVLSPEAGG